MSSRKIAALVALLLLSTATILYLNQNDEYDTSSPQVAWHSLLTAMQNGDLQAVESLTTHNGLIQLKNNQSEDKIIENWPKLATLWLESDKIFHESIEGNSATLLGGHGMNPLIIILIKDSEGWKIDDVFPGE